MELIIIFFWKEMLERVGGTEILLHGTCNLIIL